MSSRRVARFAVRCTVLAAVTGASAVALVAFSTIAMRSSRALPVDETIGTEEPQIANRSGKTSRIATLLPVALAPADRPTFMLASAPQSGDLDRFYETVTSMVPMMPVPALEPQADTAAPAEPAAEAAAPVPVPEPRPETAAVTPVKLTPAPEKPRRPAPPAVSTMLDDGAIEGLRTRLRLTADQVEYWPAVERALREVARTQLRHRGKLPNGGKVAIDVNSPEVQNLIWAAMPLLMRLRADQKSEVRKLARIMGLEQVAAQI